MIYHIPDTGFIHFVKIRMPKIVLYDAPLSLYILCEVGGIIVLRLDDLVNPCEIKYGKYKYNKEVWDQESS
jgi:hypothetical protein